jgi:hypothetical protein
MGDPTGTAVLDPPRPRAHRPADPAADASAFPLSNATPGPVEEDLPARSRIISPSLLLPAEIVVFELKPSLWYAVFAALPIAGIGAAIVLVACVLDELPAAVQPLRRWGVVVGVWIVGLRAAFALVQWLGRTYVLTDRRVIKQTGVVNAYVEELGLEDIEHTFVAQSALQRVLGIGTILFRCRSRDHTCAWEHVRRPKEVHAHLVQQIDRWKRIQKEE